MVLLVARDADGEHLFEGRVLGDALAVEIRAVDGVARGSLDRLVQDAAVGLEDVVRDVRLVLDYKSIFVVDDCGELGVSDVSGTTLRSRLEGVAD